MNVHGINFEQTGYRKFIHKTWMGIKELYVSSMTVIFFFTYSVPCHHLPSFSWHSFFFSMYLKSPHISWVSCRLQTILVTFQEKLQEKPAKVNKRTHVYKSVMKKLWKKHVCNNLPETHIAIKGAFHYFSWSCGSACAGLYGCINHSYLVKY